MNIIHIHQPRPTRSSPVHSSFVVDWYFEHAEILLSLIYGLKEHTQSGGGSGSGRTRTNERAKEEFLCRRMNSLRESSAQRNENGKEKNEAN